MAGGFRPVQDVTGNSYTGKVQTFHVAATHATLLAVGDLVRITGTAHTDGTAQVDAVAAGQTITGPIVAIDPDFSDLERKGLAASTAGFVKVATDPNILLEAETSNGTTALTDVGSNADIVATAATASGGLVNSNMTIDAATYVATTAQVRVEAIKDASDITFPAAAGTTLIVRVNESTVSGAVGV